MNIGKNTGWKFFKVNYTHQTTDSRISENKK